VAEIYVLYHNTFQSTVDVKTIIIIIIIIISQTYL